MNMAGNRSGEKELRLEGDWNFEQKGQYVLCWESTLHHFVAGPTFM